MAKLDSPPTPLSYKKRGHPGRKGMRLEETDMNIRTNSKVDSAIDFAEHGEIAGFEILDDSNYAGFSPEYPKMEVVTFEIEKIKMWECKNLFKALSL